MSLQQQCDRSKALAAGAMAPIEKFYCGVYLVGTQETCAGPKSKTFDRQARLRRPSTLYGKRKVRNASTSAKGSDWGQLATGRACLANKKGQSRLSGGAGTEVKRSGSASILELLLGRGQVAP